MLAAGSIAPRTAVGVECGLFLSRVGIAWREKCIKTFRGRGTKRTGGVREKGKKDGNQEGS